MDAARDPLPTTGGAQIDEVVRGLQARCAPLADMPRLDQAVANFKARMRALFNTEEACLADGDAALRETEFAERETFEAFADEVLSAAHVDNRELQRFAMAWCAGHLHCAAMRLRRRG